MFINLKLAIKIFNSRVRVKNKDIMAHGLEKVKFITWFSYENFILHSLEYKHFSKGKDTVHNVREVYAI